MPAQSPARFWSLDPDVDFLNHGSFGACPTPVLAEQAGLRTRMEGEPVRFMLRELPDLLDAARIRPAVHLGAEADGVGFVPNATAGVNAVLRSMRLEPGDEILVTDHGYNACTNAAAYVARRWEARVVVARVPFPLEYPEDVVTSVLGAITPRTRIAVLDHVTSPTALVFPIGALVAELEDRGIDTLVDGAQPPGMVPLAVDEIGAAYYTGNCHKWLCAPKGTGFLSVRADRRESVVPVVVSHGYNAEADGWSRFRLLFDWVGTADPTPYLSVSAALDFLEGLDPGGIAGVAAANHSLAVEARNVLCDALGVDPPAPDAMLGSMAALPLPDGATTVRAPWREFDPLQDRLFGIHGIEVPVVSWPAPPRRLIRVSAQRYNRIEQYERLAEVLRADLDR